MALTKLTLQQLNYKVHDIVKFATAERPLTGSIFQLLRDTGLRVNEALETERWTLVAPETFSVALSKGEGSRELQASVIPEDILPYYLQQKQFELQTYSSINNTFKRHAPGFIINTDKRRTTSHIFRYRFIKQRHADGQSIAQIAEEMGHINQANTAAYVVADIWAGLD